MQSRGEFIALLAMLFAMVAFSIDSMLPALPRMAEELTPDAPNRAQLVLTFFVVGLGIGTFVMGPISDAFDPKRSWYAKSRLMRWNVAPSPTLNP